MAHTTQVETLVNSFVKFVLPYHQGTNIADLDLAQEPKWPADQAVELSAKWHALKAAVQVEVEQLRQLQLSV